MVPQPTECPDSFYDQIQGQLEILGYDWCDLMLYTTPRKGQAGNRNSCVLRVPRNASHFESTIAPHLESFGAELRKRRAERQARLYGEGGDALDGERGASTMRGGAAAMEGGENKAAGEGEGGEGEGGKGVGGEGKRSTAVRSGGGGGSGGSRRGWQLARLQAHQALLELVATALEQGSRHLPRAQMRLEHDVDQLPEAWGVAAAAAAARGGGALLLRKTPDLVAADLAHDELLVVEVTIVPDAALGRYYARKCNKYAALCRAVEASYATAAAVTTATAAATGVTTAADATLLNALPPVVIAVGTSGTLHPASVAALKDVIGLDEAQLRSFAEAAGAIAAARPGSRRSKASRP